MIRSNAIITFAISLLLWSGQAFGDEPQMAQPQVAQHGVAVQQPCPDCSSTACPEPCPTHGRHCQKIAHRHVAGQPCPLTLGLGQRLGRGDGRPSLCPLKAMPPMPMGPAPSGGFLGSLGTPRPYQYDQMPAGYPQGYPQQGYPMQPMPVGQQPAAYPQQNYPGYMIPPANERIVYIPYAMPPPITVERLAKALPIPRPLTLRRVLGDANMYEYPEMPLNLYTTRGPRDFLAPNPPSIGE